MLVDPVVESIAIRGARRVRPRERWRGDRRPRPAQARRDRPRGRERPGPPPRPRLRRRERPDDPDLPGRRAVRWPARLVSRVLANDAVEQAVVGPLPFDRLGQGTSYRFARVEVPILGKSDAELLAISKPGSSTSASPSSGRRGPLRRARPRADRLRAGDPGPDLERALLAQDAPGRIEFNGRIIDNLLKRTIFGATQADGLRLAGQRLRRQRGRRPVRRRLRRLLQGRDPQPPLGDRPLRRGQHRARRRDPRPPGHRPGRQADLQHRRLLRRARPTPRATPCPAASCTPGGS